MRAKLVVAVALAGVLLAPEPMRGEPPAQRLPSALLVFPLVQYESGRDTRIELVNLTRTEKDLLCAYVSSSSCGETNFYITLTPNQPISWLMSQGLRANFSAVPPFSGNAELKCTVLAARPEVENHNAIQGRAVIFGSDGQTIGYSAFGFRRLTAGDFTGTLALDGATYEQCPAELHFAFIAADDNPATTDSEIVLAPCSEDLLNQIVTETTVQFRIVNEFEQVLSASIGIRCFDRRFLGCPGTAPCANRVSSAFEMQTLGTLTGHAVVRGVQVPVIGMLIDRFRAGTFPATAANEPFLRGGRSALVVFP